MLNRSLPVFFTVMCLLIARSAYAVSDGGVDMFRTIEHFENNTIKNKDRMRRSPFVYEPIDPALLGYEMGTCNRTCKETAQQFISPVKNGRPIVSEDDY